MFWEGVIDADLEKDGAYVRLLLKRESGIVQVIEIDYDILVKLRDQASDLIPVLQDEMRADLDAENEQLNAAEQRAIEQRETEREIAYHQQHPFD